jgi:hypothetical protein
MSINRSGAAHALNAAQANLRPILLGLVLAAGMMVPVSHVSALQDEVVIARPPTPSQTAEPPIITTYLLLAVLVAAGLAVQALPSKRGHQD